MLFWLTAFPNSWHTMLHPRHEKLPIPLSTLIWCVLNQRYFFVGLWKYKSNFRFRRTRVVLYVEYGLNGCLALWPCTHERFVLEFSGQSNATERRAFGPNGYWCGKHYEHLFSSTFPSGQTSELTPTETNRRRLPVLQAVQLLVNKYTPSGYFFIEIAMQHENYRTESNRTRDSEQ